MCQQLQHLFCHKTFVLSRILLCQTAMLNFLIKIIKSLKNFWKNPEVQKCQSEKTTFVPIEKKWELSLTSSGTKPGSSSKSKVLNFVHLILTLLGVTKNGCCQVFDISEQLIFLPPVKTKLSFCSLRTGSSVKLIYFIESWSSLVCKEVQMSLFISLNLEIV